MSHLLEVEGLRPTFISGAFASLQLGLNIDKEIYLLIGFCSSRFMGHVQLSACNHILKFTFGIPLSKRTQPDKPLLSCALKSDVCSTLDLVTGTFHEIEKVLKVLRLLFESHIDSLTESV